MLAKVASNPARMHRSGDNIGIVCVYIGSPQLTSLTYRLQIVFICISIAAYEIVARYSDSERAILVVVESWYRFRCTAEFNLRVNMDISRRGKRHVSCVELRAKMPSRLLRSFFEDPLADNTDCWLPRSRCCPWRVVMVMSRMCGMCMVVMMVMRLAGREIGVREWIRREAWHVVWPRSSLPSFVMVVMMVVRMHVMMVMMRSLRTLAAALQIWCASAIAFQVLCIVPGPPSIASSSSRPSLRAGSPFVYFCNGSTHQVAALDVSQGRTHARWCSVAVRRMVGMRLGRGATNACTQTREHSAKFHLDSRVIPSRTDVSRLCALDSLR